MSKSQRTKGASGERELCRILSDELGKEVRRNLAQTREGGCDIRVGRHNIEVKRRARIGNLYEWMAQAASSCEGTEQQPVVICRADGKKWLAVMTLQDWINFAREDL